MRRENNGVDIRLLQSLTRGHHLTWLVHMTKSGITGESRYEGPERRFPVKSFDYSTFLKQRISRSSPASWNPFYLFYSAASY